MRALAEHSSFASFASQMVSNLLATFDIVNFVDVPGNRSLRVASYKGYLPVVEFFIRASHPLALVTNHHGNTFLELAVVGFKNPTLSRLCKHTKLMKQLISETILKIQDIFNVQNAARTTVLHISVIDSIQCELAKLLMFVPSLNLSNCDAEGRTSNCPHAMVSNTIFTNMKTHVNGGGLGTSFKTLDAVIFLYTGLENASNANYDLASVDSDSCSSELINSKATYYRHLAMEHECHCDFYAIVPEKLRWLVLVVSSLATVVRSQAINPGISIICGAEKHGYWVVLRDTSTLTDQNLVINLIALAGFLWDLVSLHFLLVAYHAIAQAISATLENREAVGIIIEVEITTEGSLQFKQWDPGGCSLVYWECSLDLEDTWEDIAEFIKVFLCFNLEDKVVLDERSNDTTMSPSQSKAEEPKETNKMCPKQELPCKSKTVGQRCGWL